MPKPRDYKAENARRHLGQAREMSRKLYGDESSFHVHAQLVAIKRVFSEEEVKKLAHNLTNTQVWHLSEIARLDPKLARELGQDPAAITPTYQKYRTVIASLKKRRVGARDRIERAWPGLWSRWSEKFAPEDLPAMRQECARRIIAEMEDDEFNDFINSFLTE
jgi:hypothetical protein